MLIFDFYFMESFFKNNSVNLWVYECKKILNCDEGNILQCYLGVYYDGYVLYVIDVVFLVVYVFYVILNCSISVCIKKWSDVDIWDFLRFI